MGISTNRGASRRAVKRPTPDVAADAPPARETSSRVVARPARPGTETGAEIEQIYLDEISEIALLDRESEVEVATVMDRARAALVEHILTAPCHFLPALASLRSRPGEPVNREHLDHLVKRLQRAQARYLGALRRNAESALR